MMDENKEIREMAKTAWSFLAKETDEFVNRYLDREPDIAHTLERLYEANYRKADEVCKKTAKEMGEKIKMAFYYHFDEIIPSIMADEIDKIVNEYTVRAEE